MYVELFRALVVTAAMILIIKLFPKKPVVIFITLIYLAAIIYFVGFRGARSGLSRVSMKLPLPFWRAVKARHYGLTTNRSVLNVLLFVPFGYLLPHIISWKDGWKAKWWMVVIAGFVFSLIIETSQLVFRFGVFELDDLVKNTMGAGIGFLVWKALERVHR